MVRQVVAFVLIILCCIPTVAAAETRLRFTAVDGMRHNPQALSVLQRAYSMLGIRFSVVYLTPTRSIHEVENGFADGELLRIKQIGDHFTEIVRVEVPVISLPVYGYTNDKSLTGLTLNEMETVRVGYVAGALFAEMMTAELTNVTAVESPSVLFNMLEKRRLDVAIAAENPGDHFLKSAKQSPVYKGSVRLRSVDLYHYLNRRHTALVPRLERVLSDLIYGGANEDTQLER
jgi:polar amino acid transport system substrate-binding protein